MEGTAKFIINNNFYRINIQAENASCGLQGTYGVLKYNAGTGPRTQETKIHNVYVFPQKIRQKGI